jgi:hypothetical protein
MEAIIWLTVLAVLFFSLGGMIGWRAGCARGFQDGWAECLFKSEESAETLGDQLRGAQLEAMQEAIGKLRGLEPLLRGALNSVEAHRTQLDALEARLEALEAA